MQLEGSTSAIAIPQLFKECRSATATPQSQFFLSPIIFNIPHPSLLLHIHDKSSRNAILLLIQEVKRDLIYRRMNLPPSAQQVTDPRRITAHLFCAVLDL
jgi:hypothetical protein